MSRTLLYLYRGPEGLVAAEAQIEGAPLAGSFMFNGEAWVALGFGRMLRRGVRSAEVEPITASQWRMVADRMDRLNA